MKKFIWCLVVVAMCVYGIKKVFADGSNRPVLDLGNGVNYLYPSSASSTAGGVLVNNGVNQFSWSNTVIGSTTSATIQQFPAFPVATSAKILALQASTTGQMVICSDCAKSSVCVSTGSTAVGQFVAASSVTFVCN